MSRRRRSQPDSLELLLDTMCNTFGGIIMIALLIALLSRDASSDAAVSERTDSVRRQLETAQRQTIEAEKLRQGLTQSTDPAAIAALQLLTQRDQLRQQIESNRATIQSNTTTLATLTSASDDPAETERLIAQRTTLTNELHALQEQVERDTQARQRQLRLPRERVTGKKTFYFIVRFGKIFPVFSIRDGRREQNTQTLEWRETSEGQTVTPRRELGLDGVTGLPTLARSFNDIPAQTYSIHFLVYEDSFPSFLAARQIPLQRGYDVGWEFLAQDRPVVFSSQGAAPPAL